MNETVITFIAVVAFLASVAAFIHMFRVHERLNTCLKMVSSLGDQLQKQQKSLDKAWETLEEYHEALEDWAEAGKLARKSEEDFNEGLNNILNYQPNVKQKGDKN